ncbi:MAG: hypothetical protein ACLFSY_06235 [Desulfonatronovibrionaceae bacterium]
MLYKFIKSDRGFVQKNRIGKRHGYLRGDGEPAAVQNPFLSKNKSFMLETPSFPDFCDISDA